MTRLRLPSRLGRMRRLTALVLVIGACGAAVAGATAVTIVSGFLVTSSKSFTHATCTLTPAASDTYVDENNPTTANGSTTTLLTSPRNGRRNRIYIAFDLASCSPAIPATAQVDFATLTLTTTAAPPSTRTLTVRRVSASWTPAATTWNVQPSFAGTATTTLAVGTTIGAKSFDVADDVNDYLQSGRVPMPPPYTTVVPNFGWVIADEGGTGNATIAFASSENATTASRPQLVIAYGA